MYKQKTDGVEMTLMIIHFSASHEDILITVCLSNYNTVCSAGLAGKQAHGKQVRCSSCSTKNALWGEDFNP